MASRLSGGSESIAKPTHEVESNLLGFLNDIFKVYFVCMLGHMCHGVCVEVIGPLSHLTQLFICVCAAHSGCVLSIVALWRA